MTDTKFWGACGKLCKKRSRTYIGNGNFYYGSMNKIQDEKWRACHD